MERLFTYGTLQIPRVQSAVFGRIVSGTPDTLTGFYKGEIQLGAHIYPILKPDPTSRVVGLVIEVTTAELALIDRYEGSEYRRVRVRLESGNESWVYCE